MGEWKVQVSVRVLPEMRRELEVAAAREHRTLGNLGGILIEWALELHTQCEFHRWSVVTAPSD
ncbi:MAG: hypothetical protein WCE61_05430 [Candidatus Acidiferrum sp.]